MPNSIKQTVFNIYFLSIKRLLSFVCSIVLFAAVGHVQAQAIRVADINAGTSGSSPSRLAVFNSALYFAANGNDGAGTELWKYIEPTLPIELLDFKGTPQYNGNILTWQTTHEVNNKGFQIERLAPQTTRGGEVWDILGFKTANNKSSTYDFTDNTPLSMSYYRLRQIDNDGKETLSKVISVSQKGNSKLITYPNPVSHILTVETENMGDYQILNLLGQQVLSGKAASQIDVSNLLQGSYFLKMGAGQVRFTKL